MAENGSANGQEFTGIFEVADAVKAAIASAHPQAREALAKALLRYQEDFPDETAATRGQTARVGAESFDELGMPTRPA